MERIIQSTFQLGKALQTCRKEQKISQKKLAEISGLLEKTISALENTPEKSTVKSLFKLLSSLDIEIALRRKNTVRCEKTEW